MVSLPGLFYNGEPSLAFSMVGLPGLLFNGEPSWAFFDNFLDQYSSGLLLIISAGSALLRASPQ